MDNSSEPDEISLLIAAMNKAEKRTFTQLSGLAQGDSGQGYMRLYRCYLGDETFESADLPEAGSNHIRQLRHQLRQHLFRALRYHHGSNRPEKHFTQLLEEVEFLSTRALYRQAAKRLRLARKVAAQNQDLKAQIRCIRKDLQVQFNLEQFPTTEELAALHAEEEELEAALLLEGQARRLYLKIYHFSRSRARIESAEQKRIIDRISLELEGLEELKDPEELEELKDPEELEELEGQGRDHFWTQVHLLTGGGMVALLKRDFDQAGPRFEKLMELWAAHSHLLVSEFDLFLTGMRNYLSTLLLTRQFDRFYAEIQRFSKWPARFPEQKSLFEFNLMSLEMLYHMNSGEIEPARPLVRRMEKLLDRDQNRLPQNNLLLMCYNVAQLFFLHSEFKTASAWCLRIDRLYNLKHRMDLQEFVKILYLFILFEREASDLMDSQLRTLTRYLKKVRKPSEYESFLIASGKELAKGMPPQEIRSWFEKFHQQLEALAGSYPPGKLVGMPEMLLWTQSRMEGRSLKSLFVEKCKEPWD